jgi:hypothetical protein
MEWIGVVWLRIGTSGGLFVNTGLNVRFSIKCWEVLEWLHNWRLLKKGSAVSERVSILPPSSWLKLLFKLSL